MSEDKKDSLNEGITPMTDIEGTPVALVATVPMMEEEALEVADEILNLRDFLLDDALPGVLKTLEQRYPPNESANILYSALLMTAIALYKRHGSTNKDLAASLEALAVDVRQHGDSYAA